LTTEQQRRVRELFDAALDQPADRRQTFLAEVCGTDQQLRETVGRLLAAKEKSDGVLDTPVWQRRETNAMAGEPGTFIGPYKILQELGGGGMGIVYQAVRADEVFQRISAVKVIRPELSTDWLLERFRQERQILARLDHVNIARIVDGGSTPEGLPYFVMDYVDGPTINRFCAEHGLGVRARLGLFQQVCAAVQYLHRNGVIHGDLKPPNILVGVDGAVKLVDFGIASAVAAPQALSPNKRLPLMTPGYASAEQMRGEPLTPASDVYSLGVILYELLTGVIPFPTENRSSSEMLKLKTTQDPAPPSVAVIKSPSQFAVREAHIDYTLRGDLDSIVMRAVHRDPAKRYTTVASLAADIDQYLQNRPVVARESGMLYRAMKFFIRQQRAALAALVICTLLATTAWQGLELRKNRNDSRQLQQKVHTLEVKLDDELRKRKTELSRISTPGAAAPDPQVIREMQQSQLRDVNNLAQAYRTSFTQAVRLWPGMTPERRDMLDHTDRYLRQAEPFVGQDSQGAAELANAWLSLANIQGNPKAVNLQDRVGATASIHEANRLLEKSSGAPDDLVQRIKSATQQIDGGQK
jgi:serine/threonine protein kinase